MVDDRTAERVGLLIDVMMGSDDPAIMNKAGRRIACMGLSAIPALTEMLKSDVEGKRTCASIALAMMGEQAIPAVGELMRRGDREAKLSAMVTLAMIRSEMEEKQMGGETVDGGRFVKGPVKCRADEILKPRARRRSS